MFYEKINITIHQHVVDNIYACIEQNDVTIDELIKEALDENNYALLHTCIYIKSREEN